MVAVAAADEDARSEDGRGADGGRADAGDDKADDAANEEKGAADDGPAQMDIDTEAGPSTVRRASISRLLLQSLESVSVLLERCCPAVPRIINTVFVHCTHAWSSSSTAAVSMTAQCVMRAAGARAQDEGQQEEGGGGEEAGAGDAEEE